MIAGTNLLFIQPRQPASPTPLIARAARRMCAVFRNARQSDYAFGGIHNCFCGAHSTNCDYHLPGGELTNSICIHYLAHHRPEVPVQQVGRVEAFTLGEAEPNDQELAGPQPILSGILANVERSLGRRQLGTWITWGVDALAFCGSLQNGFLGTPVLYTEARQDAEDLYFILCAIPPHALRHVQQSAIRSHGDVRSWGADALRVGGWKREAWAIPLADPLGLLEADASNRRLVAMSFRVLGSRAGAAIPAILELAKQPTRALRHDVLLALGHICQAPGLVMPE